MTTRATVPHRPRGAAAGAYVYRCYDARERLIYVGSSIDPAARMVAGHRTTAWWYGQVERVESEAFADLDAALTAEIQAIKAEAPRWNIKHKLTRTRADVLDMIQSIENGPSANTGYNQAVILKRLWQRYDAMAMGSAA